MLGVSWFQHAAIVIAHGDADRDAAVLGNDREGSDLDLLVDPLPGATLLDLGGLQVELEEMLGVSIDLVTPGDLPLKFRSRVLAEAVPV